MAKKGNNGNSNGNNSNSNSGNSGNNQRQIPSTNPSQRSIIEKGGNGKGENLKK